MMKLLITIIFLGLTLQIFDSDVSMYGIKINDSEKSLKKIKLETIANDSNEEISMIKYRTDNGNDFSVTSKKGKIVYLENDWLHDAKGEKPLLTNFVFGKTPIKEIIKIFGTRGFLYKKCAKIETKTDIIEFYCFELDSPNNEILALVTKASLSNKELKWYNMEDYLVLEAVIIANKEYLDEIWGTEKLITDNNKKIKL